MDERELYLVEVEEEEEEREARKIRRDEEERRRKKDAVTRERGAVEIARTQRQRVYKMG